MHKASYVMYSIANFFTWIVVIFSIAGIVLSVLGGINAVPAIRKAGFGWGYFVYFIVLLIVSLITIMMVRRAKAKGTSKAWVVLFIDLGVLGANIFYILGVRLSEHSQISNCILQSFNLFFSFSC